MTTDDTETRLVKYLGSDAGPVARSAADGLEGYQEGRGDADKALLRAQAERIAALRSALEAILVQFQPEHIDAVSGTTVGTDARALAGRHSVPPAHPYSGAEPLTRERLMVYIRDHWNATAGELADGILATMKADSGAEVAERG